MKVCVNCELQKLQKDRALDDIEFLLAVAIVRAHNPEASVVDEAEIQCAASNANLLWREIAAKSAADLKSYLKQYEPRIFKHLMAQL